MDIETNSLLAISGLTVGLVLGIVIQRSRFCMTAVISNWVLMRDSRQLYIYLTAMSVAVIGTLLLENEGIVPIGNSVFRNASIHWLSVIIGGLIFGLGAVMAGGCIGRILVLTGEGNLGALLALLSIAIGATASYTGILEPLRIWVHELASYETTAGDASILAILSIPSWVFLLGTAIFLMLIFIRRQFNAVPVHLIATGIIIGMLVVSGWWITGWLATDEFSMHRPASLTFAGPVTSTALYISIGNQPQNTFGIALMGGVLLGSFLSAFCCRSFRISPPEPTAILRILSGGMMMGMGAIMAGGCNIGQGLSGLSTLSLESILAVIFIFSGMFLGVKWLQYAEEHGSLWAFLHFHHGLPKSTAKY